MKTTFNRSNWFWAKVPVVFFTALLTAGLGDPCRAAEAEPEITVSVESTGVLTEKWTFEFDRESAETMRVLMNKVDEEAAVALAKQIEKIPNPYAKAAAAVAGGLAYYHFKTFKAELNKKGKLGKKGIRVEIWALKRVSLREAAIATVLYGPTAGARLYVIGHGVAAGSAFVNPKSWTLSARE